MQCLLSILKAKISENSEIAMKWLASQIPRFVQCFVSFYTTCVKALFLRFKRERQKKHSDSKNCQKNQRVEGHGLRHLKKLTQEISRSLQKSPSRFVYFAFLFKPFVRFLPNFVRTYPYLPWLSLCQLLEWALSGENILHLRFQKCKKETFHVTFQN